MIEALRSVRYGVTDLAVAQQWYSQLLELEPYMSSDTAVRYFVDGSWLEAALVESPGTGGTVRTCAVNAGVVDLHQADDIAERIHKACYLGHGIHRGGGRMGAHAGLVQS